MKHEQILKKLTLVPKITSAIGFVIACTVLLGWIYDIDWLKSISPAWVSMKGNTALCFFFLFAVLWITSSEQNSLFRRRVAQFLISLVLALAALSLLQYWTEENLKIDELLFKDVSASPGTSHPGRPSILTLVNFLLLGVALLLALTQKSKAILIVQYTSLLSIAVTFGATLLYLYGLPTFPGLIGTTHIAVHTIFLFAILALGILCINPQDHLMKLITGSSLSSQMARRMISAAIVFPVGLGWLRLQAERLGVFQSGSGYSETGMGVFTVTLTLSVLFTFYILQNSRAIQQMEDEKQQRDNSEELLAETTAIQKMRIFLNAAPDAIVVVNKSGCMVMVNQLTENLFRYKHEELIGQKVELLVPERFRVGHEQHRTGYFAEPRTRPMGEGRELAGRRKDGTEFPIEISLSPIETEQEALVISIIRDVGPRKQLEAKFRGLLESAPDGIVVVDTKGKIVIINSQTEKLFGYSRDELIGQPIEILVPPQFKGEHVAQRDAYIENPKTRPMGAGRSLTGRKKNGTEFPVEISLSPLETEHGTLITSIVRDITDRRVAEEQLQLSLREKEFLLTEKESLLKEIHHRVKNNLQVTSSLLRLQSEYIQDPRARDLFAESQNRIRSMALVHEKLYRASNLSRINFSDYVESLVQLLFRSYGVDTNKIKLMLSNSTVNLSIESAVPCGLIINELISNCIKHAFTIEKGGEIIVQIESKNQNQVSIMVSDNGVGLPKNFDFEKTETLGLQLVRTLVKQLNGAIEVTSNGGAHFNISFIETKGVA